MSAVQSLFETFFRGKGQNSQDLVYLFEQLRGSLDLLDEGRAQTMSKFIRVPIFKSRSFESKNSSCEGSL